MDTWKIVAIVAAVVVAGAALAAYIGSVVVHRRRERARIATACAPLSSASIFVMLVATGEPYAAAETVASLFERAVCPLRVYVGIFEAYDSAASIVEEYELRTKFSRAPFCLKDHVRVIRLPLGENRGILAAAQQVERHLYKGEKYVATMAVGVEVAQDWDAYCVDTLAVAAAVAKSPRVILTSMCAAGPAGLTTPGTYCGLHDTGALLGYGLKHMAVKVVPALAWSSTFSFAPAARVTEVPYERYPDTAPDGMDAVVHDTYMTVQLLRAGWALLHPAAAVVGWTRPGDIAPTGYGTPKWRQAMQGVNRGRAVGAVFAYMGVLSSAATSVHLSARSRLGLTPAADEAEIIAKVGSMGEYLSVLSRLELQKQ
jgi:hypothetical protein